MSFVDSYRVGVGAGTRALGGVGRAAARLSAKLNDDTAFASRFTRAGRVLADRLRSTVATLATAPTKSWTGQALQRRNRPETLDAISLAGARFEWIQKKLRSV